MSHASNHIIPDLLDSDLELLEPDPDQPPAPKEYVVEPVATRTPGTGRYRVTHNTPDGAKVYYVSYGSAGMHCTCPDAACRAERRGRCKHCQAIARLIGKPHLAGLPDPSF